MRPGEEGIELKRVALNANPTIGIKRSTAKLTFWPPALAEIACPAVASLRRKSLI